MVSRPRRRGLRLLLAAVGVPVLLLVASGTATAHARLVTTDPAVGSVLLGPPDRVVLHFDDVVTVDAGSVRVFGPDGRRVDEGDAGHPGGDPDAVAVGVQPAIGRGSYVVAWRVISDDGHPVHGAYVFSVGSDRGAVRASVVAGALATGSGAPGVGAVAGVLRWIGFAGLTVLVGLALLTGVTWPDGGRTRRVRRMLWTAWAVTLVATVAGIAVEGVYGALLPLGDMIRPSLVGEVLRTRFGRAEAARALLLVVAAPLVVRIGRGSGDDGRPRRGVVAATVVVGAALVVVTALAGHAGTGTVPALGLVLDVVHLGGASVWVGGLVLLAVVLVRPPPDVRRVSSDGLTRTMSAWLLGAAVAVVLSGTAQSFRQVGSRYALFHTTYGRTLLIKIVLVVVLVAFAAVSRRAVHGSWGLRRAQAADGDAGPGADRPRVHGRLVRTVVVELTVVAAVLGVTAALVNDVPARQAAGQPFTAAATVAGVQVNAIVDPARAGIGNDIHVYVLSRLGTPEAVLALDVTLRLPSGGRPVVRVPLHLSGPGHYYATDVMVPVAGTWALTVVVRAADGRSGSRSVPLPVH